MIAQVTSCNRISRLAFALAIVLVATALQLALPVSKAQAANGSGMLGTGTAMSGQSSTEAAEAANEAAEIHTEALVEGPLNDIVARISTAAAKNYFGYKWANLPFLAASDDGLTANGTPGITVSDPEPLTETFDSPAYYQAQYFSNDLVDGARIRADSVVTIRIPAEVLNPDSELAKSYCKPDNDNGNNMLAHYEAYGPSSFNWAIIQSCLDYAHSAYKESDGSTLYRIKLPAGTYEIGGQANTPDNSDDLEACLHLHSNTWLDMTAGTTLVHKSRSTLLIRNAYSSDAQVGYEDQNIIIDGGTIKGLSKAATGHDEVGLGHAKNVVVRHVTFDGCYGSHHLELAGISGASVFDCTFMNYTGSTAKEAIQLDVTGKSSAGAFSNYDYTTTQNVVVHNNKFSNLSRGVGSHYAYFGYPNSRILVQNNVFTNLKDEAVYLISFDKVAVLANQMDRCREGLRIASIVNNASFYYRTGKAYGTRAGYLIKDNRIAGSLGSTTSTGMTIYGNRFGGAQYRLANVRISNNIVNVGGMALCVSDATGVTVEKGSYTSTKSTAVVFRTSAEVSAANVTAKSATGTGFSVATDSVVKLTSCIAKKCGGIGLSIDSATVTVSKGTFSGNGATGIAIDNSNATVSGCTTNSNKASGVTAATSIVKLSSHTAKKNTRLGLYVADSEATVKKGAYSLNKKGGIRASDCTLTLTSAKCNSNTGRGLRVSGTTLTASKDTFKKNTSHGLQLSKTTAVIKSCKVQSNGMSGLRASHTTITKLKGNLFKKNKGRGVYLSGKSTIDSKSKNTLIGNAKPSKM